MIENELFKQLTEEDREDLILTIDSFLEDNVITDEERDFLSGEAKRLHIDCSEFWKIIDEFLKEKKNNDSHDKQEAINSLYKFADLLAGKLSISLVETNLLHKKAEKVGISSAEIDEYVNNLKHNTGQSENNESDFVEGNNLHPLRQLDGQNDAKDDTDKNNIDNKRKRGAKTEKTDTPQKASNSKKKNYLWVPIVFIVLSLMLPKIISMKTDIDVPVPFEDIVIEHPSLIFQKMSAQTYLIYGTSNDVDSHHYKIVIYLVKATGSFSFDMRRLSEDKNGIDGSNTLYLTYNSDTYFPCSIDVDIDQNDILEVDEIKPEPLNKQEYKKYMRDSVRRKVQPIASFFGAAIVGAGTSSVSDKIVGGPLNDLIKHNGIININNKVSKTLPIVGAAVGAGAGYLVGHVAGGVIACIRAIDYDNDFKVTPDIGISDKELVFKNSKPIIATQMMNLNLEKDAWNNLRKEYESQITESVKEMVCSYGWNDVKISFNYN